MKLKEMLANQLAKRGIFKSPQENAKKVLEDLRDGLLEQAANDQTPEQKTEEKALGLSDEYILRKENEVHELLNQVVLQKGCIQEHEKTIESLKTKIKVIEGQLNMSQRDKVVDIPEGWALDYVMQGANKLYTCKIKHQVYGNRFGLGDTIDMAVAAAVYKTKD